MFLDALQPLSVVQGWGTLQKNRSVWDKPLTIGGQHFRRGMGTHANSEIVYRLDGKYGRFQAWAGPDMATLARCVLPWSSTAKNGGNPARCRAATHLSGSMSMSPAPQELRLLVDDAGDNIMGDHADWADARLLHCGTTAS